LQRQTREDIHYDAFVAGERPASRFHIESDVYDEAYDPGTKSHARIQQKAQQKYLGEDGQPRYNRVRDISRMALLYDTPASLLAGLAKIRETFIVLMVENRFAAPTALGWRDVTVLVSIPVEQRFHISELQLQLKTFALARKSAHKHYVTLRKEMPQVCKVPAADMDRVQAYILDKLNSHRYLTELEDFEEKKTYEVGTYVDEDVMRMTLLRALQACVFKRYAIYYLEVIIFDVLVGCKTHHSQYCHASCNA